MMEAITIGPIPREMMLPNSVPMIIARYSNLCNELLAMPYKGIFARTKNEVNTIKVHFNFVLNGSFFSIGPFTSGRLNKISFKPIFLMSKMEISFNTN
jgi:hypothetical protein